MDFGTFKARLRRKLLEPDDHQDHQYPDELLHDAAIAALAAIQPWFPLESSLQITGNGSARAFVIAGATRIISLWDASNRLFLGDLSMDAHYVAVPERNDWMEYPAGTVLLATTPGAGISYTVYYETSWPAPENSEDDTYEFPTQPQLDHPLLLYAKAYCIDREATQTADVRRWAHRASDAGNPEQNPMEQHVLYLLRLFEVEMERLPKRSGRA